MVQQRAQLNFVTDVDSLVAMNSQMGLLAQKMDAISRASKNIFQGDPFANMFTQASRASGALSAVLANLQKIYDKQVLIGGLGVVPGSAVPRPAGIPAQAAPGVSFASPAATRGNLSFHPLIPMGTSPTFRPLAPGSGTAAMNAAYGVDNSYGPSDASDAQKASETVRQIAITKQRIANRVALGMTAEFRTASVSGLNYAQGLVNTHFDAGSMQVLGTERLIGAGIRVDNAYQRNQRGITLAPVNDIRNRVDDYFASGAGQGGHMTAQERSMAQSLRAEAADKRSSLSTMRQNNNLGDTGYDTNSIRSVIKGLDSEVNRLDRAMRQTNTTAGVLNNSFLKMAGAVIGMRSLADLFMNATQQAVQFDRVLMQIQARSTRMTDPTMRKGFVDSVTQATLSDAVRTGMPIAQLAQVQETVHLAAPGTFAQKSALGSTINNLALTTDVPITDYLGVVAPMSKAGFQANDMQNFLERSSLFQSRYGVDKSRMNAFFTSYTSSINGIGPLADADTIEAAARQEAAGARDMVLGSKLNRIQTGFMSAKTRTRLNEILGRSGKRDSVGDTSIESILNTGNAVVSMDMMSKAYQKGDISQKELLGIGQSMDMWAGNQTYSMLTKGLDTYRKEITSDKAAVAVGAGSSDRAAAIATNSIGGTMDRMTNAITALTVNGISPLGNAMKMLMNVVTAVSSGFSRIPYVTEGVVLALSAFAAALATQKAVDWTSTMVKNMEKNGSGIKGMLGGAGAVGAVAVGAIALGGWAYNKMNDKMLQDNENSSRHAAEAMPRLMANETDASDALRLIAQINSAEAKRLDTTGMRHDLELKIASALKGQEGAESVLLTLKQKQTAEMRDQLGLKNLLANSSSSRSARKDALKTAIFAQGAIHADADWEFDASSPGVFKKDHDTVMGDFIKSASTEDDAIAISNTVMSPTSTYTGTQKLAFQKLVKKYNGDIRRAFSDFSTNKSLFGSSSANVDPLAEMGAPVAYGSAILGAKRPAMLVQLGKLKGALNTENLSGAMEDVLVEQALAGKDTSGKTSWISDASFSQLVTESGTALGKGGSSVIDFGGQLAALDINTRKQIKSKATTGLHGNAVSAKGLIDASGSLMQWAKDQNNGVAPDVEQVSKWLNMGATSPMFGETLPKALHAFRDRAGALGVMAGVSADDTPAAVERQKAAGAGGGGTNYLSIMEKYFSGFERAAGQGDIEGFNNMGLQFQKMSKTLGAPDDPRKAISYLQQLSIDTFNAAATDQYSALKQMTGLSGSERGRQEGLITSKLQEQIENINGMSAMFDQRLSDPGKAKISRKLMDEALKQQGDDFAYDAYNEAYAGIDPATATDFELAQAGLKMQGIISTKNQEWLGTTRTDTVNGLNPDYGDPTAAGKHLTRMGADQVRAEASTRRTMARNIMGQYDKASGLEVGAAKAWGTSADMFGSETSKRQVIMDSLNAEAASLEKRAKLADDLKLSEEERLQIAIRIKEVDVSRLAATEELQTAARAKVLGEEMTKTTINSLYMDDPATRNQSLMNKWKQLPMQGISENITKRFNDLGPDNPIGSLARGLFDPSGEMSYRENIVALDGSIQALTAETARLANAYTRSADTSMGHMRPGGKAGITSTEGSGGGAAIVNADGSVTYDTTGGTSDSEGFSFDRGSMAGSNYPSISGLGVMGGMTLGSGVLAGVFSKPETVLDADGTTHSITQEERARVANGQDPAPGSKIVGGFGGKGFWKYNAADAKLAADKGKTYRSGVSSEGKMTGYGAAMMGVQAGMGAYAGYSAGLASGSQKAANLGAVGGATGAAGGILVGAAGSAAAGTTMAAMGPVGWGLIAVSLVAQVMSGMAAAQHATDEKNKETERQQAEYMRALFVAEEGRKSLGMAAERILAVRADVSNVFQGIGASAFLSGRYGANAPTIHVQQLTVKANSPTEMVSAVINETRLGG